MRLDLEKISGERCHSSVFEKLAVGTAPRARDGSGSSAVSAMAMMLQRRQSILRAGRSWSMPPTAIVIDGTAAQVAKGAAPSSDSPLAVPSYARPDRRCDCCDDRPARVQPPARADFLLGGGLPLHSRSCEVALPPIAVSFDALLPRWRSEVSQMHFYIRSVQAFNRAPPRVVSTANSLSLSAIMVT